MNTVLLFVFLASDATPQEVAEYKRLRGTWEVVEEQRDGKAVKPELALIPPRVRFTDERPPDLVQRCDIYTVRFDPKPTPRRITATVAGGEIKGVRMLVTYRLDGDRLTMRMGYGAKVFPAGFETKPDDGTTALKLRRVKGQ